ncbi:AAA family ATPase [Mobiluncus porci]|nr:AAA family ATPase [Mobiluncus porci]
MFILYGPQGSGKTTFVQENQLAEFSVSADEIRRLFSRYIPATDGGQVLIAGEHLQRLARRIVSEQADNLMFLGSPVIIDAVNASERSRAGWHALADSHGYDVLAVDFTQVSREELISRNDRRGGDKIPDIESFLDRFASVPPPQTITPSQMLDCFKTFQIDLGNRPVVVVGDVQSCGEALGKAVEELGTPDTKWVFVGDLFDRGPDAGKVWRLLKTLDAVVVTGNHEKSLLNALKGRGTKTATDVTMKQLLTAGATRPQLEDWYRSTVPFYDFKTAGKEFFVSHGGVLPSTIREIRETGRCDLPDDYFIFGVGTRANTYRRRYEFRNFEEMGDSELVQLHGHRNEGRENFVLPGVIDLESGVEKDGWLSVYAIDGTSGQGEIRKYRERAS